MSIRDLGVQLYQIGNTAALSYKDKDGATVALTDAANLLTSAYKASGLLYVARGQMLKLRIKMKFTHATTIQLKAESASFDTNNPTIWPVAVAGPGGAGGWEAIQLSAQDDAFSWVAGSPNTQPPHAILEGPELIFTPNANPAGSGYVVAFTTSSKLSGAVRLSALCAQGGLDATDYIIVGAEVVS